MAMAGSRDWGIRITSLVGSLVMACSSTSNKTYAGSGGTSGNSGSACADLAGKYCDRIAACAPGWLALFGLTDVAACQAYYTPGCDQALAAPHSSWSASLAEQCATTIGAMTCPPVAYARGLPSLCLPHGGTFPDGAACSTGWQCAGGRCLTPEIEYFDSCGTCATAIQANQSCNVDSILENPCADNNLVCLSGFCVPIVSIGDPCSYSATCPANAYCDRTTNVCTKLPGLGQTCDPVAISFCDLSNGGTYCNPRSSTCEAVTAALVGGACDGFTTQCSGDCAAVGDAGAGVCTARLPEGASCTPSDVCDLGGNCFDGVCTVQSCGATVDAATSPASVLRGP